MASEKKMQQLQNKLSAYYGRLQTIYDQIAILGDDPIKIDNFLGDAFTLDTLRNDFIKTIEMRNEVQISITDGPTPSYNSVIAFEQLFAKIKYKVHQLTAPNTQKMSGNVGGEVVKCELEKPSRKYLPNIELCSFNGDIASWPIFYESFRTTIHENTDLTDGNKIQFLMGKLQGKALAGCQGILPTAENYTVIWNNLVKKYNDKRVLAATYLERLLNLPTVSNNAPTQLEEFIDKFSALYLALKQLDFENLEDFVFVYIASKKINNETYEAFEYKFQKSEIFPKCNDFIDFVKDHVRVKLRTRGVGSYSAGSPAKGSTQGRKNSSSPSTALSGGYSNSRSANNSNVKTFVNIQERNKCLCCGENDHSHVSHCAKFLSMIPNDRYKFIKGNKMCVNCLHSTHTILNCKSTNERCNECAKRHNSLLHFPKPTESGPAGPAAVGVALCAAVNDGISRGDEGTRTVSCPSATVLLGTAQCHVLDATGNIWAIRALIDSASQRDLITTECCKRLNLKISESHNKYVSGVGDVNSPIVGTTCLTIRSRINDSVRYTIQPVVVNNITSELPIAKVNTARLNYLNNIMLADCNYHTPGSIDLIIGSDLFARILRPDTISRDAGEPVAVETSLGYIIIGQAPVIEPVCNTIHTLFTLEEPVENRLNRFFELEEVPNVLCLSKDDENCERYYNETTRRTSNGQYVVSLPFKYEPTLLGDSMRSAERRYLTLERKLLAYQSLKEQYDSVFLEYLQRGYMRPVGTISEVGYSNDQYVIPHHAVVRHDKSTTKLRVVLDASNTTSSGKSLNDLLYTGPNLQNNIFDIILKFRLLPIAVSADIRQMYLRIHVDNDDLKYQRILYRFNSNEPLIVYEITRVPFGLRCSPYLAMRTVRRLVEDERDKYPVAAAVAETELYMDDLATSCQSDKRAIDLASQLIKLFETAGFELVKFASNSRKVMANIPSTHRVSEAVEFSPDNQLKVLGLLWLPAEDVFTFVINVQPQECTKRQILSTIARLWDVMGYVAPVTLLAKLIIKSLWENNVDWDESPPSNIISLWQTIESELHLLQSIKLPRHVSVNNNDCVISIIGFADASERAYGGAVYLHVYFPNDNRSVMNLLCAKSRVAPSKTVVTLARMELCANVILAKLMRIVLNDYSSRCKITNTLAFTDSKVALAWIVSNPNRWQTFVANRVAMIQNDLHPRHFRHISGKENPADCLSRGLTPSQLIEHPLWLHGPPYSQLPVTEWPMLEVDTTDFNDLNLPEEKVNVLSATIKAPSTSPIFYELATRVSSWHKLLRIVIYVLRFIKKLPKPFSLSHLDIAEEMVIKDLQLVHFPSEIKIAQSGGKLPPSLIKLNAFLRNGILRVGGRLRNSDLDYDSKHPILLPSKDHVVNLIIDYYHRRYLHTGPQLLMSLIRQKYWILSARNIVRKRVQNCVTCFKANPKPATPPLMADLPAYRVQQAKAFCHTGLDFAGPIAVLPYRRRGVHSIKAYLCLFICLATKAIHLELASDLSTDAFLNAFKRFISRRGPISTLYSDNGTNFIGANSYLNNMYRLLDSEQYKDRFANELRDNHIEWKFNPASAPHFGGIWEGNIRSVKSHLSKIVGTQLLTFEEMTTVIAQIEAILNSRPLSVLSSDPSEPQALTPAHFLVMTPLKSLPSEDVSTEKITLLQRKRIVDHLVQCFWKRWKVEYLNTLQTRAKWLTPSSPVREGTIVLLQSENSAPLNWPLGIIERTFPGRDGISRVVDVKTKSGVYRRPVVKVIPLPNQ